MFRDSFRRRRCIIPASGYHEWTPTPSGKQPYFISAADGGVLSFAGVWHEWRNPETGAAMKSCTIIVTDANMLTRIIHNRMPAILDPNDIDRWLACELGADALKPAPEDVLRMWPVSRRVNKTGAADDVKLIEEVKLTA